MLVKGSKSFVTTDGVQSSNDFTILASAKAFDILISGLYSNKIKAFIRELSTNAYEAHQMLGIEDKPFDVTLPTISNPNFIIRDYGPGLSPDEIRDIYTVVFKSTKDGSNDLGGCMGLGSKSPFAYVGKTPFSVTSIYNGIKYFYSCYRNESGVPRMDLLHSDKTKENSGVEISVPINRYDFDDVKENAEKVYAWFDTKPNVKEQQLKYDNFSSSEVLKGPCFTIHNQSSVNYLKMGNILYPLDFDLIKGERSFHGIIIYAPIGSVTPDPSRERLSYDPYTVGYLQDKLEEINHYVTDKVEQDIAKAANYYEAMKLACEYITGFPGMQIKKIKYDGQYLGNQVVELKDCKVYDVSYDGKFRSINSCTFRYYQKFGFFCNDAVAHKTRLRDYLKHKSSYDYIIVVEPDNLKSVCDQIGCDESYFVKCSSLPYIAPLKGTTRNGNAHKTRVLKYNGNIRGTTAWDDCEFDIYNDDGYYVEYFNNKCRLSNGNQYDPYDIIPGAIKLLGLPDTTVVYGIKSELLKKRGKDIKKMKNLLTEVALWYSTNVGVLKQHAKDRLTLLKLSTGFIDNLNGIITKQKLSVPSNYTDFFKKYKDITEGNKYLEKVQPLLFKTQSVNIYTLAQVTDKSVVDFAKQIEKRFPLLNDSYYYDEDGSELKYYLLGKGF